MTNWDIIALQTYNTKKDPWKFQGSFLSYLAKLE